MATLACLSGDHPPHVLFGTCVFFSNLGTLRRIGGGSLPELGWEE